MEFRTVANRAEVEIIEKRSRFLGACSPVKDETDAIGFINSVKEKHRGASHNVYAYSLRENNIARFTDDGEPQGTAGLPVLDVIKKENLCDVCIVVTRYFGGTLLGTGGLVRAYSLAAKEAVNKARIITMRLCDVVRFECHYSLYNKVCAALNNLNARQIDTLFSETILISASVSTENTEQLRNAIMELTSGKAYFVVTGTIFTGKE